MTEVAVVRAPPFPFPPEDVTGELILADGGAWRWLHSDVAVGPAVDDPEFHERFAAIDFNDLTWAEGLDGEGSAGGFGYGDPVGVDIGMPPAGFRYSAYFRRRFETTAPFTRLQLRLFYDDGVIVYLDGVEVARANVPAGPDAFELEAESAVAQRLERALRVIPLSGDLGAGLHVLAISLHNAGPRSSDLAIGGIELYGHPR